METTRSALLQCFIITFVIKLSLNAAINRNASRADVSLNHSEALLQKSGGDNNVYEAQNDGQQIFVPPFFSNHLLQSHAQPRRMAQPQLSQHAWQPLYRQNNIFQPSNAVAQLTNYAYANYLPTGHVQQQTVGQRMENESKKTGAYDGRRTSTGWMANPYPAKVVQNQPTPQPMQSAPPYSPEMLEQYNNHARMLQLMPYYMPQYPAPVNQGNRLDVNRYQQGDRAPLPLGAATAQALRSGGVFFEKPNVAKPPDNWPKPIKRPDLFQQSPAFTSFQGANVVQPMPTTTTTGPPTFVLRTNQPPSRSNDAITQQQVYTFATPTMPTYTVAASQPDVSTQAGNYPPAAQTMLEGNYANFMSRHNQNTSSFLQLIQSEHNYCNPYEFDGHTLASVNLKRVDYFVINMTCSNVFYQCASRSTFVRNCPGVDQVFDESTLNCNYRYNVKSCGEYDHVMHCTVKHQCASDEYACCAVPQQCIPYAKRCDGVLDCADGEDENNCPTCSINEFPCLIGGTCIPMERRCNGMPDDCFDGTDADEKNCDTCGSGKYYCYKSESPQYGTNCIDAIHRCDGVKDCHGGEDELNCKRQGAQYLLCENQRQSVPRKQWCDGREDCADASDEAYCEY